MISYLNGKQWEPIDNLILVEGHSYKIRIKKGLTICAKGLQVVSYNGRTDIFTLNVPFSTGICSIDLLDKRKIVYHYESYIYPDDRKIVSSDYLRMLSDILSNRNLSISLNIQNQENKFKVSSRSENVVGAEVQFILIERCFEEIISSLKLICTNPLITRERHYKKYPSYRGDRFDSHAAIWVSQNSSSCFIHSKNLPSFFKTRIHKKDVNILENQIIVKIVRDLASICTFVYRKRNLLRAKQMEQNLLILLNNSPLRDISYQHVIFQKTHKIRTNKNYLFLYNFYDIISKLIFQLDENKINLLSIPISKTYKLYEIWSFLKILDILKAKNKISKQITLKIEYNNKDQCIDIVHGLRSKVSISPSYEMYYQLTFKKNGSNFYTYTTDFIPDICIICNDKLIIFDSKYRISENIGGALSELHKYRDGIVKCNSNERAVLGAYILVPTYSDRPEVHDESYHKLWNMGCIHLSPSNTGEFEKFLETLL